MVLRTTEPTHPTELFSSTLEPTHWLTQRRGVMTCQRVWATFLFSFPSQSALCQLKTSTKSVLAKEFF